MLAGIQRCYGGVRFPVDRPSPRNVLRLDMGAIPLIHKMHQSGIFLDTTALSALDARITEEMASTLENLQLLSDRNLNPNSGDQVARILYDELNLHKKLSEERANTRILKYEKAGWDTSKISLEMKDVIRMTSSGSRLSTDDEALSQLQHLDPLVPLILDYRGLSKLKNTYTKAAALPRYLNPHTGRIHTHFNVCRAATGRLASSEPNLQNIPTRGRPGWVTNWGNEIRKCFKAMYPDTVLASMDLSQIEMVWAAYVSRDPRMMKVFLDNEDLHTMTALAMFRLNPNDVQPDPEKRPGVAHPSGSWPITWKEFKTKYRLPAKTLGFGILYGVTPRGLQQQILSAGGPFWTEEECEEAIKLWYAVYQGVYEWTCWQHSRARRYGCVWDHFGRWREVPEVRSTIESVISAGLRQAGNMPIQSGAQGVIKLAMAEVVPLVEYYQSLGEKCIPLLQIHDELLFELSHNIAEEFCAQVREIMQNAVALPIPIGSSRDIAATLGDLK